MTMISPQRPPGPTWIRVTGMLCTARIFTVMDPYLRVAGPMVDPQIQATSLDRAADQLLDLVREHPGPVNVIGLSLGAIIAMAAATTDPDAFDEAVLISTNARAPRQDQLDSWRTLASRTSAGAFADVASEMAPTLFAPSRAQSADLLDTATSMARQLGSDAFLDQLKVQLSRRDLRSELPGMKTRTLVLAGSQDQLCNLQVHREITEGIPGAQLHTMPGLGHLGTLEDPATTAGLINRWSTWSSP